MQKVDFAVRIRNQLFKVHGLDYAVHPTLVWPTGSCSVFKGSFNDDRYFVEALQCIQFAATSRRPRNEECLVAAKDGLSLHQIDYSLP